ncbi:MAG: histidine kinase [Spirochaetales bacterium]|nr:histidine kinase [Spirochaetales bacterium]
MKKLFRPLFYSLHGRLMIIILFILFLPLILINTLSFKFSERVVHDKIVELQLDNMRQIAGQINIILLDIVKLVNILSVNEIIQDELFAAQDRSGVDDAEQFLRMVTVERQIMYSKVGIFFNYESDVLIIDTNDFIYSVTDMYDGYSLRMKYAEVYKNTPFALDIIGGERGILWEAPFQYDIRSGGAEPRFITAARGIYHPVRKHLLGHLLISVGEEQFKHIMKDQDVTAAALFSGTNQVIFEFSGEIPGVSDVRADTIDITSITGKEESLIQTIDGSAYLVSLLPLGRFGWKLVSLYPYERVVSEINRLRWGTLYLTTLFLLLFTALSLVFLFRILTPLKRLIREMKSIRLHNHTLEDDGEEEKDDIGWIVNRFHILFGRIKDLSKQVLEEQKRESELRYQALLAQVTPHFLFNTLDHIKWTAMMSGAEHVSSMISSLGNLLEYSVNRGEEEILLEQEIELVKSYLVIQESRLNRHLHVVYEISPEVLRSRILKFVLQPIVENSLIHGFRDGTVKDPTIRITAKSVDETLSIQIEDNGTGIDTGKTEVSRQGFSGIGLSHTRERIRLHYGRAFGLWVSSGRDNGTVVKIRIPYRRGDGKT